ncbi:hypothetical protein JM18_004489 [Phytophthora kernoviae]|uniref:CBM1 domain-containing protein n=1 Tax=Phytophthora kernoviae TaxID=325452 RepID=A0A921SH17_9STRA|nr:hypothetical protein JM18_004489 [Phytophthora kernoviae]
MKVSTLSAYGAAAMLLVSSVAATEQSTPAPTTTAPIYDEELGCWPISVEHDATYCIDGPICSGNGPSPTGSLCPVKAAVAAIAGVAIYRQHTKKVEEEEEETQMVDVITP